MSPTAQQLDLGSAMKLLADPLRLRILALLAEEELSVGELSRCLDVSQSRTSNHLRLLREAGLLSERHVGTSIYLRLVPSGERAPTARRLFAGFDAELEGLAGRDADRVRLEQVRAQRSDASFFDRVADRWDKVAGRFEHGLARERTALQLLGGGTFADLGCGTGYIAESLLGLAERLILVDQSEPMLEEARRRLAPRARGTQLEFHAGTLDALPLADASCDGVLAGMVLHHMADLDAPLAEMRRVLVPGGRAVVLELSPHRETWMREAQGDRHLGLAPEDVFAAFERAGFHRLATEPIDDRYRPRHAAAEADDPALSLYLVRGTAH
ncbi:MAG: metalloregulator ArsR/SmtB family transcription factor [Planctomycetota bacterium]